MNQTRRKARQIKPFKLVFSLLLCLLWTVPVFADIETKSIKQANKEAGQQRIEPEKKPNAGTEWYLKNTLELVNPETGSIVRDSRSGVMGQLADSEPGFDRHDIPAFASTTGSRAAIVFEKGADWEEMAGEYLSDYRRAKGQKDDWVLTVHSRLSPDQVTLRWDGLFVLDRQEENGKTTYASQREIDHRILDQLHLIDLDTGEVIKAVNKTKGKSKKKDVIEFNSYEFSMTGQTRRDFRWVLGALEEWHFEPVTQLESTAGTAKNSSLSSLEVRQLNAARDLTTISKFGTPPE
jgi:hypothetical protein